MCVSFISGFRWLAMRWKIRRRKEQWEKCWNSSLCLYLLLSRCFLIFLKLPFHKSDKRNSLGCKHIPCFLIVWWCSAKEGPPMSGGYTSQSVMTLRYAVRLEKVPFFPSQPHQCKNCTKGRSNKMWCRFNFYDPLEKLSSASSLAVIFRVLVLIRCYQWD